MSASPQQDERYERLRKFRESYFFTSPVNISKLAADGMIVVIDLEEQLREAEARLRHLETYIKVDAEQAQAPLRALVGRLAELFDLRRRSVISQREFDDKAGKCATDLETALRR